jgi:hypothetical protein
MPNHFHLGAVAILQQLPSLYNDCKFAHTLRFERLFIRTIHPQSLSCEIKCPVKVPCAQHVHVHVREFALLATRTAAVHTPMYCASALYEATICGQLLSGETVAGAGCGH